MKRDKVMFSAKLADYLGETNTLARRSIAILLDHCGADFTYATCFRACKIHASTGMQRPGGGGPRTVGGIFFVLMRSHLGRKKLDELMSSPLPEGVLQMPPPRPERLGQMPPDWEALIQKHLEKVKHSEEIACLVPSNSEATSDLAQSA